MGYAVELYFDLPSSSAILDCWEKLSSICLTFNAKPHISLAIFDDIDTGQMERIVKEFAKNHSPIEVSMPSIGSFLTDEGVLYFSPVVTDKLLKYHNDFFNLLDSCKIESNDYYKPDSWVPHCTLDLDLDIEDLAKNFEICKSFEPIKTASG
jgi:2'-5' RNA ligase